MAGAKSKYTIHTEDLIMEDTHPMVRPQGRDQNLILKIICGVAIVLSVVAIACSIVAITQKSGQNTSTNGCGKIPQSSASYQDKPTTTFNVPSYTYITMSRTLENKCTVKQLCWYTATNNYMYGSSDNEMTFTDAKDFCSSVRGNLVGGDAAYLHDLQTELIGNMSATNFKGLWIGLTKNDDGKFAYANGVIATKDNTNWGRGEPVLDNGSCAILRPATDRSIHVAQCSSVRDLARAFCSRPRGKI